MKRNLLAIVHKTSKFLLVLKIFIKKLLKGIHQYQPNPFSSDIAIGRMCKDRFDVFSNCLPDEKLSTLDIGCNEGFFTFKMAERGGLCIGIDWGYDQIQNACDIAHHYKINNAVFARMEIDEDNINSLPKVDVIICLSIYHHWARKFGEDVANNMLEKLAERSNRFMIFETGQPNETDAQWRKDLDFMGSDYDSYIKNLLQQVGFKKIKFLGEHNTTVSSEPRSLFLAEKIK